MTQDCLDNLENADIEQPDVSVTDSLSDIYIDSTELAEVESDVPATGVNLPEETSLQIKSGKLAGKSLPIAIAMLAIPILLEQFANALVGLVDVFLTGHMPDSIAQAAMDGVGIAAYVRWFIGIAVSAIGIGGMALIARATGANDIKLAHRSLGQATLLGLIAGILVAVALWVGVPWVAKLAQLSPEATIYCNQYIRIVAVGLPATSILFTGMMCLHGVGETTRPFLIMLVVNVVNIVLSWVLSGVDFTFGSWTLTNPFSFDLNVVGIAIGTAGARLVGAFLMVALMLRGVKDLKLNIPELKPHLETMWRITRIGIPNFFEGLGMWVGQLVGVIWVIGMISKHTNAPEGLMGAHMIAVQWEALSFMPGYALGVAAGTLAGQFLGANNPKMAARAILICMTLGMILMGIAGLLYIFGGSMLTAIISQNPLHLEIAPKLLFICGLVQVFFAMSMVIRGGLRGVGDTKACMIITWVSTYAIRIPLAWMFGYWLGYGLVGVWIGLCSELVIRGLLFLARFLHGGWKTVIV